MYTSLGRLVRWVKPRQEPKTKIWKSFNSALVYEPKRMFRWILKIDGLDSFTVKSSERPNSVNKVFQVELYDPIKPSASHKVWKWQNSKELKTAYLEILDPVGLIVESWQFKDVKIQQAFYGMLDYSSSEPCIITLILEYSSVDLI
jgi:hypothetical protein